jgi:hypothetical protein
VAFLRSIVGETRREGMRKEFLKTGVGIQNLLTYLEDKRLHGMAM